MKRPKRKRALYIRQWDKILNGTKTEHRQVAHPLEWLNKKGIVFQNLLIYERGHVYTVYPGKGLPRVMSALVTNIRSENLQDISDEGIASEGCVSRRHFQHVWDMEHRDATWSENPKVWVFSLEPAKE